MPLPVRLSLSLPYISHISTWFLFFFFLFSFSILEWCQYNIDPNDAMIRVT